MKNKKLIITATGNDEYRYHYDFEKNSDINTDKIIDFMKDLGFDEKELYNIFYYYEDEKNEKLVIKNTFDLCPYVKNKEFDVEFFFGKDRFIIFVRTKKHAHLIKTAEKHFRFLRED